MIFEVSLKQRILFILWISLLLAGCGIQGNSQDFVTATASPTSDPQILTLPASQDGYPGTPEGVVHAFITVFPENPADAIQYLSPDLVAGLTPESLQNLLQLPGAVEGYMMLEGSGSAESETSQIKVAISSNQQNFVRSFTLVIRNGLWQITGIAVQ